MFAARFPYLDKNHKSTQIDSVANVEGAGPVPAPTPAERRRGGIIETRGSCKKSNT